MFVCVQLIDLGNAIIYIYIIQSSMYVPSGSVGQWSDLRGFLNGIQHD